MIESMAQAEGSDWSAVPALAWRLRWELVGKNESGQRFETISEWTQETKPSWTKSHAQFRALDMRGTLTIRGKGQGGSVEVDLVKIPSEFVLGVVYYNSVSGALANMPVVSAIGVVLMSGEIVLVNTQGQITRSIAADDIVAAFATNTREERNANGND